jgi:hypothetical protein
VLAYPGCPTLTWLIASRICNKHEESDAFVSFTGRKGSSKSTSSIAFCESLAEDVARIRGRGEPPEQFFNMNHIKSISETGAIDLLASGALKEENSIFLLDDSGTQNIINKSLNSILQICRIYRCCLVANFIMKNHIDVQARTMTDYRAEMLYKNTTTGQAFFKFFYLENTESGEYKKYLTWKGKRIKTWVIEKPSEKLNALYKAERRANTDEFIEEARLKVEAKLNPKEKSGHKKKNYAAMPEVIKNRETIREMFEKKARMEDIIRATGMTRYMIQRTQAINEGKA